MEFRANFHIFFSSYSPNSLALDLMEFLSQSSKIPFIRPPTNLTNITKTCLFKYIERILPPKNKKKSYKTSDLFIYLFLIRIFAARVSLLFKEQQARTLAILASFAFIQTKSRILICSYHEETLTA